MSISAERCTNSVESGFLTTWCPAVIVTNPFWFCKKICVYGAGIHNAHLDPDKWWLERKTTSVVAMHRSNWGHKLGDASSSNGSGILVSKLYSAQLLEAWVSSSSLLVLPEAVTCPRLYFLFGLEMCPHLHFLPELEMCPHLCLNSQVWERLCPI